MRVRQYRLCFWPPSAFPICNANSLPVDKVPEAFFPASAIAVGTRCMGALLGIKVACSKRYVSPIISSWTMAKAVGYVDLVSYRDAFLLHGR